MVRVKEKVETLSSGLTEQQQAAIRILGNDLHRLNQAVMACVESGLSIEIQRTARHHTEAGYWGDLMVPVIMKQQ
jgi:hypothetical protein